MQQSSELGGRCSGSLASVPCKPCAALSLCCLWGPLSAQGRCSRKWPRGVTLPGSLSAKREERRQINALASLFSGGTVSRVPSGTEPQSPAAVTCSLVCTSLGCPVTLSSLSLLLGQLTLSTAGAGALVSGSALGGRAPKSGQTLTCSQGNTARPPWQGL